MTSERPDESAWRPAASFEALRLRARLLEATRSFFLARDVLEVETPLLGRRGVTDLHLHSLTARCTAVPDLLHLQTSPEYAMKRLLAAGSGDIFQICKAFRDQERGRRHNPEFTMLEWYRLGLDHHGLMAEAGDLLEQLLTLGGRCLEAREGTSYTQLFEQRLGIDPRTCETSALEALAGPDAPAAAGDRDDLLALLLTRDIEPHLPPNRLIFVYDYPPSQAALARLGRDASNQLVAHRFEAYLDGVELANGFWELTDAAEQRARFEDDLVKRRRLGLPTPQPDDRLLGALAKGLPDCAGVAVGFDRVAMLAAGALRIDDVLAFPVERA
ncbi:MAG: EF-P lysine aminoacylase EpmA [Acidobacteriota bacterium]